MKEKLNHQLSKKIFVFLTVMLTFTASISAQDFFYYKSSGENFYDLAFYNPFTYYRHATRPKNLFKDLQIKEKKKYSQSLLKDTVTYLSEQEIFDKNGYAILEKKFTRKGKTDYHRESTFNDKGILVLQKNFNNKDKLSYSWSVVTNDKENITESKSFNKKGILVYHSVYLINEKRQLIESNSYRGKKQKLYSRMVYTYYPGGEKESTTKYDGKGKIEKVWSYACSSEGVEIHKKKDTVQVCKIADYNKDGGFTITNRTINTEGQLEKTITKYNKDSIQIEAARYDIYDRLVYKSSNKKIDNGWFSEYTEYYVKSARPRTRMINVYNDNQLLIQSEKTYYKKNTKILRKNKSDYYGIDHCLNYMRFKKGGIEMKDSTTYNYLSNGLLNEVIVYDEKANIITRTRYQYQ